ncbi:glutamate--tRNA ligase [Candidatus Pacearchaeota archaeon]|nr:glutamate--tRNA ligase [Candidatus Pacearchaeota archaeon]
MKNLETVVRAYALKNAIAHGGKAQVGAVISPLFLEGLKKEDMKTYGKKISEIVSKVNSMSLEEQKREFEKVKDLVSERKVREGLEELPNVPKTGVVMRFGPAPSGPMHIGHALTGTLSFLYFKKYGGKFYSRIEDTNPEVIEKQFYDMIKEDVKWLFNNESTIIIQSERMKLYYTYAEKFIKKSSAYVCTCSSESFKELAEKMEACPCRDSSVKENTQRWKKMLDKKGFKQGEAVLRFKSDIKDPNPAMRDFPLARINLAPHPLQKKKYKVWPLMNLAVTADDIETKVTHAIRGKDHRDNAKKQELMYSVLGEKPPWTFFLGKIKFKDIALSKRKLKQAVADGEYSGWDDPNIPTLISLRKRGYKPQAFWKLLEQIGLSENDKVMSQKDFFELLDHFNKDTT